MSQAAKIKEKLMDYCLDEGILGKKLPDNPNLDFGFELNFPPNSPRPVKIMLIKPKEKKPILLQIPTQIAPKHMDALNKAQSNGLMKFLYNVKKYLVMKNLSFNIDAKNGRYIISEIIYPDGLNENVFYKSIRNVFNSSLYINLMMQEMIAGKIEGDSKKDFDDFNFSSGGTMYS